MGRKPGMSLYSCWWYDVAGVVAGVVETVVAGESVFNWCEENAIGAVYKVDQCVGRV